MRRRGDRLNRILLIITALKIIVLCTLGLLASYRVFGDDTASNSIVTDNMRDFVDRNHGVFWPATVGVALVVGYFCYRWLRVQFSAHAGQQYLNVGTDPKNGLTRLDVDQLSQAFGRAIELRHGIPSAVSRMYVRGRRIDVEAVIALDDLSHAPQFVDELGAGAFDELQKAIGRDDVHLTLRIRFAHHAVSVA